MISSPAKAVAVAAILVGTWATAEAATLTTSINPTVDLQNVHAFNEAFTQIDEGTSTLVDGSVYLSENLGSVSANGTIVDSNTIAYSEGTSTYAGTFATSGDSIVLGISYGFDSAEFYSYLETGSNFEDLYGAIETSNVAYISSFVGNQGDGNGPFDLAILEGSPEADSDSHNLFVYSKNDGVVTSLDNQGYASYSVDAVPEPASMAALGFGALALLRRRRK